MIDQQLQLIADRLKAAAVPEDVFGELKAGSETALVDLKGVYRSMAKRAHPDMYRSTHEKALAQRSFALLTEWYGRAQEKIKSGLYGMGQPVLLKTTRREYEIWPALGQEGIFNWYDCSFTEGGQTHRAVLRVVREPRYNDLALNEVRTLKILEQRREWDKFSPYFPGLLDAFIYDDAALLHQAAVFEKLEGWYSLEEVHARYPHGIDPKDMAWIWRRLLVALGFAHLNSVIHGAVLPPNVWIQPEQHGLMLRNWFSSVYDRAHTGELLPHPDSCYAAWYPRAVLYGEPALSGMDIVMSARCMIYLLGGDGESEKIPHFVPEHMRMFLRGSILPGRRAPQDAWALKQELDDLLERLWGQRKFHPFQMTVTR
jgi:hypothetical protein